MKDGENGKKEFDMMTELEGGLNMGIHSLEQAQFLLNEVVHRVEGYPRKGLEPETAESMLLDLVWVHEMIGVVNECAANARSAFLSADTAFEELWKLHMEPSESRS